MNDTLKQHGIQPHIARHTNGRRPAIDRRAAPGNDYAMSLRIRKCIEQGFGWIKTTAELHQRPLVALSKVRGWLAWTFAAYNLISGQLHDTRAGECSQLATPSCRRWLIAASIARWTEREDKPRRLPAAVAGFTMAIMPAVIPARSKGKPHEKILGICSAPQQL